MDESHTPHCLVAAEGDTRLEKTGSTVAVCFSLHAVRKRMAAPQCGSGKDRKRETNILYVHVMALETGASKAALFQVLLFRHLNVN